MANTLFINRMVNQVQNFHTTPPTNQKQILDQVAVICQKLDDYLNSSPGEQQCFLTRQVIAEAKEGDPHFVMAKSLSADPVLIKNNVNKIANPVLNCLRSFIDGYSK